MNPYGTYGYGSSSPNLLSSLSGGGTALAVLVLIAFIAAVVLTVIGYRRYIAPGQSGTPIRPTDRTTWGPFLRFDTLLLDRILKALYLFSALFIAFFGIATVLASLAGGVAAFILALVGNIIGVAVGELICRVIYETIMLNVIIARNTGDIKQALGRAGGEAVDTGAAPDSPTATAAGGFGTPPAFTMSGTQAVGGTYAPPAPEPTTREDIASAPAESDVVDAPPSPSVMIGGSPTAGAADGADEERAASDDLPIATGTDGASAASETPTSEGAAPDMTTPLVTPARFCPGCGKPVKPGQKFCGVCGTSLE